MGTSTLSPETLLEHEIFWRDHQQFLAMRGYMLRPRFHPKWKPSWRLGKILTFKNKYTCEDSLQLLGPDKIIDAIRLSDNVKVVLKRVETSTQEIPIGLYFSREDLRNDPRNHCVPILDVILFPDTDEEAFIVMPFLRKFDDPQFEFKCEYVDAVRQFLEGLVFMHEHNVTHLDACYLNIMMDTSLLIPDGFHFSDSWSHAGTKWRIFRYYDRRDIGHIPYYFIDFGLSRRYPSFEKRRLIGGRVGQDRTVPEFSDKKFFDPFKVDIYQLGGVFKEMEGKYTGLDFLHPLVEAMQNKDPDSRPDAATAMEHFERIVQALSVDELNVEVIHISDHASASYRNFYKALRQPIVPQSVVPRLKSTPLRRRIL